MQDSVGHFASPSSGRAGCILAASYNLADSWLSNMMVICVGEETLLS